MSATVDVARPTSAPSIPSKARLPLAVPLLALFKLALTLAVSGQYGYHRDELYYLASARHLAWGYVDYPPVSPFLARLDVALFGNSLPALRLLPILAGSVIVVLAALIARELGGGRTAQTVAAFSVVAGGIYLGGDYLFETVAFDQLCWAVALYLMVRLLRTGNLRLWLPLGLTLGIGLETKYTIAGLIVGLGVGLLATRQRSQLRTQWPWLGAAGALVLIAPNGAWQIGHGWPSMSYLFTHHGRISHDTSRLSFVLEQLILANFLLLPVVFLGFRELWRRPAYRTLFWAAVSVEVLFFVVGGKSYYASPIFVLLYAAGAVPVERFMGRGRLWWPVLTYAAPTLCALLLLPIALPVFPARTMAQTNLYKVRSDYGDMVGWPEFVRTVAGVYDALPASQRAHTRILLGNYGEAGAVDFYGPRYGLPPALSGHLTYYYWKPAHVVVQALILVQVDPASLEGQCRSVRQVATIRNALGVQNEEDGEPVLLCTGSRIDLDAVWQQQLHYD